MRTISRAALLLAVTAAPMAAQRRATPAPEMIPRVVVDAALGMFGSLAEDRVRFTVGAAPDGWPQALAPGASAMIIGGSRSGPLRNLVVSYPRSVNADATYGDVLRRAGFRRADSSSRSAPEGFGMRMPDEPRGTLYCDDSSRAMAVTPIDSTPTRRRVQLTMFSGDMRPAACAPRDSARTFREPRFFDHLDLRVPPLRPPVGAVVRAEGASSGGAGFNVHAKSDTALSASELIAHYGRELARGGWTLAGAPISSGGSAMQALRARDPKGNTWQGALTVYTVGDERQLSIMMTKPGGW